MDSSPSTPRPSSALGHALSTLKRTFTSPRRPALPSSSNSTSSPASRSGYATAGPSHARANSAGKIPSVSDIAMGLHRSRTPHLGPSAAPSHHAHSHVHAPAGGHAQGLSRRTSLGSRAQSYPAPQSPSPTSHRRPGLPHLQSHSHTLVPAPPATSQSRRTTNLLTPTKSSLKKQKAPLASSSRPAPPVPSLPVHIPQNTAPSVQSTQSLTSTLLSSEAGAPIPSKLRATSPTRGVKARFTRLLRPGPPPVRTTPLVGHDHDALQRARAGAGRGGGPPSMESSRTSFEDGTLVSSAGTMRSMSACASDDTHGHGVRKAVRFAFKEGPYE